MPGLNGSGKVPPTWHQYKGCAWRTDVHTLAAVGNSLASLCCCDWWTQALSCSSTRMVTSLRTHTDPTRAGLVFAIQLLFQLAGNKQCSPGLTEVKHCKTTVLPSSRQGHGLTDKSTHHCHPCLCCPP